MVMHENNIFYKTILSRSFSVHTRTGESILHVLEHLISRSDLELDTKITLDELRKIVPSDIPDDDFIHSVFYLTRSEKNVQALRQIIEAFDEYSKTPVEISPRQFIESIRDGKYIHPLSSKPLTAEQYQVQVLTFFKPTQEFLDSLDCLSNT